MFCSTQVLPHVERHLVNLILKSGLYQYSFFLLHGTGPMEATVMSQVDGLQLHRVVFRNDPHEQPKFCCYSQSPHGFPFCHFVTIICYNSGPSTIKDNYGTTLDNIFNNSIL